MDGQEIISVREFARRVQTSEGNIRKVIKAGKIFKGLNSSGKIIWNVALTEYKEWYGHKMPEVKIPVKEVKPAVVKTIKQPKAKEIKVKNIPIVADPMAMEIKSSDINTIEEPESNEDTDTEIFTEDKPIRIRNSARFEEAKRLEQVIKTRTAQLEYEQLKGSLVSSKQVYKELYAVGQTVRSAMQGIPDKYIDNLLACETRSEAHEMLTKAITQALEELSSATKEVEI